LLFVGNKDPAIPPNLDPIYPPVKPLVSPIIVGIKDVVIPAPKADVPKVFNNPEIGPG